MRYSYRNHSRATAIQVQSMRSLHVYDHYCLNRYVTVAGEEGAPSEFLTQNNIFVTLSVYLAAKVQRELSALILLPSFLMLPLLGWF